MEENIIDAKKGIYIEFYYTKENMVIININEKRAETLYALLVKNMYDYQINDIPLIYTFTKNYLPIKGISLIIYFEEEEIKLKFINLLQDNDYYLNEDILLQLNNELVLKLSQNN